MQLYKPNTYVTASLEERAAVCNGCGAKGGIKVPSAFLGLCVKEACNIHDWMYQEGRTKADFIFANIMFLANMLIIIIKGSNMVTRPIRAIFAITYFVAVMRAGHDPFWKDKDKNEDMGITYKGSFQ